MDTAIQHILSLDPGSLLAKLDVKSAFRLPPVHVADRHLLAMRWNNQIYILIPVCPAVYGLPQKLFNVLADLLSWILMQHGISPLVHYLDDFLTMGPADSTICHDDNFSTIQRFCQGLGIPLASDKLVGPSHSLTFLGIQFVWRQGFQRTSLHKFVLCCCPGSLERKPQREIYSLLWDFFSMLVKLCIRGGLSWLECTA